MRIAAWNANHNNRRRSFDENVAYLASEGADLIVLSETARPASALNGHVVWLGGEGPGLGIVARNGFTISAHEKNCDAPELFGAFHVRGPVSLNLLAAWPVLRSRELSYNGLLESSLQMFEAFLRGKHVAMVGDLNTSSRVKSQGQTHARFVRKAAALGLTSIYHHQTGEAHGQETLATYRHRSRAENDFHIDYCFLSEALLRGASVQVLNGAEWAERSDHFPIVVDLTERGSTTKRPARGFLEANRG